MNTVTGINCKDKNIIIIKNFTTSSWCRWKVQTDFSDAVHVGADQISFTLNLLKHSEPKQHIQLFKYWPDPM